MSGGGMLGFISFEHSDDVVSKFAEFALFSVLFTDSMCVGLRNELQLEYGRSGETHHNLLPYARVVEFPVRSMDVLRASIAYSAIDDGQLTMIANVKAGQRTT